jgi:hypothetical protein
VNRVAGRHSITDIDEAGRKTVEIRDPATTAVGVEVSFGFAYLLARGGPPEDLRQPGADRPEVLDSRLLRVTAIGHPDNLPEVSLDRVDSDSDKPLAGRRPA